MKTKNQKKGAGNLLPAGFGQPGVCDPGLDDGDKNIYLVALTLDGRHLRHEPSPLVHWRSGYETLYR
jgi:hypothetical protein